MRRISRMLAAFAITPMLVACASVSPDQAAVPLTARSAEESAPCSHVVAGQDAAMRDCERVLAEVEDAGTVTVEFSDRYQAVAIPIQIWTRSWITHVDFVLPDGRLLGATPFGVRIREWTPALHTERYTFRANGRQVFGFALAQLGRRYNYVGNIGYALRSRALHDDGAWFCSELVQASAEAGGVDLSGLEARWTSPARIRASARLTRFAPAQTTVIAARPGQPRG